MNYLKRFETHQEYTTYTASTEFVTPNVSLCKDENNVHYSPYDYSQDYFTTVALEQGTIDFTLYSWADTSYVESIAYSKNDGEWVETQNSDEREEDILISVSVVEGDKIRWKGIADHIGDDGDNGGVFTSTCRFNAQGNIMSLLYGDEFNDEATIENDFAFEFLFEDINSDNQCLITNALHLVLPATTLASFCYASMFSSCGSLTTAPQLLATTLANNCYQSMFDGCTNLTTAPQLPATTLANYCYAGMFSSCGSLRTAPELQATTLADYCYSHMFLGCTSLTTAPTLSATTLAQNCYNSMFQGCTSLTVAPELPATALANYCYNGMFADCTSLTTAPTLSATTLAQNCYNSMFQGCTSLTVAPQLLATTLEQGCYQSMFRGCTSLNYIKCLATNISASNCTYNWVQGVASSGTFTKASSMSGWTSGNNGIPTNWIVQDA